MGVVPRLPRVTSAIPKLMTNNAATFIVPASVGVYTITPCGAAAGKECGTIKAYVRF